MDSPRAVSPGTDSSSLIASHAARLVLHGRPHCGQAAQKPSTTIADSSR